MPREQVVLYLRSSKDRSDVSIDAQRRDLYELAKARDFIVANEYADAVESGKDEDRPGFQNLLRDLRLPGRTWNLILALDTARISRRRLHAVIFEEQECRRHNVRILYKSLPDADPITEMLLKSVLQAMDEWHSMTSKAKGLAGMAENVRQGFRAGGTAPIGYRLRHTETGAIRDGSPVTKSKLILDDNALQIRTYLQQRAKGLSRNQAMKVAGLALSTTTLLGIEKNASTYAGHTTWNKRQEKGSTGYSSQYRNQQDWVIHKNTHEALISDEDAETILKTLESATKRRNRNGKTQVYLLSGLLVSPDGTPWWGVSGYYRLGKGPRIAAHNVDTAVLKNLREYATSDKVAKAVAKHYRLAVAGQQDYKRRAEQIQKEIQGLDHKISALVDLLPETKMPAPLLRNIESIEQKRAALETAKNDLQEQTSTLAGFQNITATSIQKTLTHIINDLENSAPEHIHAGLQKLIEHVELSPETFKATITYRLNMAKGGVKVVLPRGFEPLLPT